MAPTCGGFVYFDLIPPMSKIHRAIADDLSRLALTPEPSVWVNLILGFDLSRAALRRAGPSIG